LEQVQFVFSTKYDSATWGSMKIRVLPVKLRNQ
jgi:hypothetical protein